MTTLADLIETAKAGDHFDLDKLGIVDLGSRNVTVPNPRITVTGGKLTQGWLSLYRAVDFTMSGLDYDGAHASPMDTAPPDPSYLATDPRRTWLRCEGVIGFLGGTNWHLLGAKIRHTRCSGQVSCSDLLDGSQGPTNWSIEDCTLSDNGIAGHPSLGHSDQQETLMYLHGVGVQNGAVKNCDFSNQYNGEALKLGGVDPWNGEARGITVTNAYFHGHVDFEVKLMSADATFTNCHSDAGYDGHRLSVFASGTTHTSIAGCRFPGATQRLVAPTYSVYSSFWNGILGLNPMTTPPGVSNSSKGTWVSCS